MAKILIIETDTELCNTYREVLELAGHTVHTEHSSAEAISKLAHKRVVPDVIVLDWRLTDDSSFLLLGLIRQMPRLRQTSVIVTSDDVEVGQWTIAPWEANVFMHKPFSLSVLQDCIDNLTFDALALVPEDTAL